MVILATALVCPKISPFAPPAPPFPPTLRLSPALTACAPFHFRNEDVQGVTGRRAPQALGDSPGKAGRCAASTTASAEVLFSLCGRDLDRNQELPCRAPEMARS